MTLAIETVEHSACRRTTGAVRFALAVTVGWLFLAAGSRGHANAAGDPALCGVFVGSSPGGESISKRLQIPADAEPPVQWELTLYQHPKTGAPAGYKLHCDYAPASSKASTKLGKQVRVEKAGMWRLAKGTKLNPEAMVYELEGLLSLFRVDENILHLLNPDRSLMVGDGGWSFTLNRATAAEKPEPPPPANAPSVSYKLSPLASGPGVFGVFEGRSPCLGIARELKIALDLHRMKAKWRVTLFQNPETKSPTTYKVEGSFYRGGVREGDWSITRGMEANPAATVYRLAPVESEEALLLLQGDDNVLFFLDQRRKPLVGHASFSYTLNRRSISEATTASSTARSK